jgi:hypothetical protein
VRSARFVKTGAAADVKNVPEGVIITLPATPVDDYDTVVALEIEP